MASMQTSQITQQHVERGRQIRAIVQDDVGKRGLTFEGACESLAQFLGIQVESVKLAIAIANEADNPVGLLGVAR